MLAPFGFWLLLGLSSSVSGMLNAISEGEQRSWQRVLAYNLPQFLFWIVLTPIVAMLGRCTFLRTWRFFFGVHVPASLLVAAVQTSASLLAYWLLRGDIGTAAATLPAVFRSDFIYQFHLTLVIYWVVLAVLRGAESRRGLRDEKLRSAQLESRLAQSQLQTLRTQLQPHFLFNTLNAISALALADPVQARTMIARLSDFLRLTLEEDAQQHVSLARELEFLDAYLSIQRVRFGERLTTRIEVAIDTLGAAVPHLILQPLVENALQHGLLPLTVGGELRIGARREGDTLLVLVEDNGKGLPTAALREGIGLGNTRARLQALGAGSLDIQERAGGGTQVRLSLPFEGVA
jgi:two-component system LytT family sensor kinase